MPRTYDNVDLVIAANGDAFDLSLSSSAIAHATGRFVLPFAPLELENFRLKTRPSPTGVRRPESPEVRLARSIGTRLFEAVFAADARALLETSMAAARQRGDGVRLRITVPAELSELPWEYLYSPDHSRFLSISSETLIVRYLPNDDVIGTLPVMPPLRMLVVVAAPRGYPRFDADGELGDLRDALQDIGELGSVTVDRLERGTWRALQQHLRRHSYHVVHFIGHGVFDEREHEGMLMFEGEDGGEAAVGATSLGALLHDHRTLRLVVLNACEGGRVSAVSPYGGVAQALVRAQVPAVVAMQTEISDGAAATFAREFYGSISDGYAVDAALGEARKALFSDPFSVEWGTPALYTRWPHGELFELAHAPAVSRPDRSSVSRTENGPIGVQPVERADDRSSVVADRVPSVPVVPLMTAPPLVIPRPVEAPKTAQTTPITVPAPRGARMVPIMLLAGIFAINLIETDIETRWATLFPDRGLEFASALHWFENHIVFENQALADAVPFYVYGYSAAYFFLFPLLGLGFAWFFWRRPEPQAFQTYAAALSIDYLVSLPFFILFPVPERWAFPDADSILLSDLWSSALIDAFRPISAIDNCFPSFHTSMTVVMVLCAYLYRAQLRNAVAPLGVMIIVSTYGLGIHWVADIVSGIAVGLISVAIAYALVHRGPQGAVVTRAPRTWRWRRS
jgi:membrane-associated phospholipid phosphatase